MEPDFSLLVRHKAMDGSTIYTIGHSNHALEKLVELLRQHSVEMAVDVRSSPHSRYNPQFNRESLVAALAENGIEYAYYGNSLGGRPGDPSCYDENGVNYVRIRETEWFNDGLACVSWKAGKKTVALLCAEEDPHRCHRHHLLTQELLKKGARVLHIRGDGSLEEGTKNQEQLHLL